MAAPEFKQETRFIAVETPLGADKVLLASFSGREELGRLFEFDLDLRSPDSAIKFEDIVGQNITIRLDRPDGEERYFNGYVSRFTQISQVTQDQVLASYRATVVPWLWFLTRTSDCRIFQNKKVPDIIKEICGQYGFTDIEERLSGDFSTWVYCVQYRETDFNFLSRLMEQEGIYYFFKHENGKHTLVLCDSPSSHEPCEGYATLDYRPYSLTGVTRETIRDWTIVKEVQPGRYAQTDYNFTKPKTSLMSKEDMSRKHQNANYEVYDYPGEYGESKYGDQYTKVRLEELHAQHERLDGSSDARGLSAGYKFTMENHPRGDQNREYLITSASFSVSTGAYDGGSGEDICDCRLTAIDGATYFRSARITPKPMIQGAQTAVVVGPAGEEIHPDKYGRVKVQFHWDREGQKDENSSCWIRVAQSIAGKKWGAMFLPRIGQEVVVAFLEGDPDQPLITGLVYNDEQMPPYDPPAEKTKSYIKTNSSPGGDGFNEIRFEDKNDKEQIFIHAEKDYDLRIKNDRKERIFGNQHVIVGWEKDGKKGGDLREMVYEDHHATIHKNRIEHVGGDMQLLVGGIDDGKGNQDILLKGGRIEKIEKSHDLEIGGDRKEKLAGSQSLTVGGDQQEKVAKKHALEAGQEIHLKAGMKVIIEAGMQLTLKGPGGFVDIGPSGVTIQGTMVLINSGGAAGTGSGSSPKPPEKPQEAKPAKPAIADNASTGQKSAPD